MPKSASTLGSFQRDPNYIPDTQTTRGRTVSYEDTSFEAGDSPKIHDVNTDLGRNGRDGYIVNDGAGSLTYEVSDDGTNYGGVHTVKAYETINLKGLDVDSIRVTWVADTAYRILAV